MKITLIYSRQDIPTKWEGWEISYKSDISQVSYAKKNFVVAGNQVLFQNLLSRAYIGPLKKLLKFSNIQYPFVKQKSCPDKEISLKYKNCFKVHSTLLIRLYIDKVLEQIKILEKFLMKMRIVFV